MRTSLTALAVVLGIAFYTAACSQFASPAGPTPAQSIGVSPVGGTRASSSTARSEVPLGGTLQGTDSDSDFTSSTVVVTTDGTGIGTHLGQFAFHQRVTVDFSTGSSAGAAHWVAANGDSFDTTIAGSGHPTDTPGEFQITDIHTISGGTGRFEGAEGVFVVERVASGITFDTAGSFQGTMTSPGAAH
jgi:hypothetical protein